MVVVVGVGDRGAAGAQRLDQVGHARALHPHPAVAVARDELVDRALLDQLALADDDQLVGHQRHLATAGGC